MDLGAILSQLQSMANDHVLSSEDNLSDADSETLEAAEEEARWQPINRHHVEVFDKLPDGMRKRRYINAWPGEDMLPVVSDEKFTEIFKGHVKRKRVRRKFRLNPDVSIDNCTDHNRYTYVDYYESMYITMKKSMVNKNSIIATTNDI